MKILHPSVSWLELSKEEVQILLPDGNHVTVSGIAENIISVLREIKRGVSDGEEIEGNDEDIFVELFKVLESVGAVRNGDISVLSSTLDEYAEFYAFNRKKMLSKVIPTLSEFSVKGNTDSVIYGLMQKLIRNDSMKFSDGERLYIACADWEDYGLFRTLNSEAIKQKQPILFIRWLGDELVIGPLVHTDDSSCYECFIARRKASVNYLPEYLASMKNSSSALKSDEVFESFFNYCVGRYLKFLSKGAYHLAPIGGIERWDPIRGEKSSSIVHKIPRCDSCGLLQKSDPQASIRDLL